MSQLDAILDCQEKVEIVQPTTTVLSDLVVNLYLHQQDEPYNVGLEFELVRRVYEEGKDVNICLIFQIAREKLLSLLTSKHQQDLENVQQAADRRISALTNVNDDDARNQVAAIRKDLCRRSDTLKGIYDTIYRRNLLYSFQYFARAMMSRCRQLFALDDGIIAKD